MDMSNNFKLWKEFAKGKRILKLQIDADEVFSFSAEYKDHRAYIAAVFARKGVHVTRWNHEYASDGRVKKWGLVYSRTDTELRAIIEIYGIIDENLSERKSDDSNKT
jgi:hypothetical protein